LLSAKTMESAVPQLPAPSTVICSTVSHFLL
jgi:hypothetical protein